MILVFIRDEASDEGDLNLTRVRHIFIEVEMASESRLKKDELFLLSLLNRVNSLNSNIQLKLNVDMVRIDAGRIDGKGVNLR
jgi:hypothetical protein